MTLPRFYWSEGAILALDIEGTWEAFEYGDCFHCFDTQSLATNINSLPVGPLFPQTHNGFTFPIDAFVEDGSFYGLPAGTKLIRGNNWNTSHSVIDFDQGFTIESESFARMPSLFLSMNQVRYDTLLRAFNGVILHGAAFTKFGIKTAGISYRFTPLNVARSSNRLDVYRIIEAPCVEGAVETLIHTRTIGSPGQYIGTTTMRLEFHNQTLTWEAETPYGNFSYVDPICWPFLCTCWQQLDIDSFVYSGVAEGQASGDNLGAGPNPGFWKSLVVSP